MAFAEVPQPMQYAPRENLGVSLANAVGTIYSGYKQGVANEDAQEFQKAFGQAYAQGDYNAMQQLAAAHPQQWQTVQQGLTAIQQNNRDQLGAASSDLSLAAATGDPQAVMNVAQRHASTLQGLGIAPEEIATAFQQNPQQVRQYADMLGSHALGPEKYFTLQNQTLTRLQNGQYQQGQLQLGAQRTQIQQQQADQQAAYQQGQLQQGQQKINLEAGFNQAKIYDMQAQRALQSNKNQADVQAAQQKALAAKQSVVDQYDTTNNTLANMQSTLQQVQQIPPETFNNMFGLTGTVNNAVPWSSEAKDGWSLIQAMQGQARQMGVIAMKGTGPVSDAEGQAAAQAFLSLKPGVSAKAARTAINNWNNVLQRQAQYQAKHLPQVNQYRQQIQQTYGGQQQGYAAPAQYGGAGGSTVDWASLK